MSARHRRELQAGAAFVIRRTLELRGRAIFDPPPRGSQTESLRERVGGLDVAQVVASLAIHLEQRRHARVERPELVALCAAVSLIDRHMAERAAREGTLAEAVG